MMAATLEDIRRAALYQGLANFGASLMAASGPSRTPQSPWQGIGAGFQGFGQGYDQAVQNGTRQLLLQQQMEEQQRKQEAQAKIASLMAPSPNEQFSGGLSNLDISKPSLMPNDKGAGANAYSDPRFLAAVTQYSPEAAIGIMGQREAQKLADQRQAAAFAHADKMQQAGFANGAYLLKLKDQMDQAQRTREAQAYVDWARNSGLIPDPVNALSTGAPGQPAAGPTVGAAGRAAAMPGGGVAGSLLTSGNPELAKLGLTSIITDQKQPVKIEKSTDMYGNTQFTSLDPKTGKIVGTQTLPAGGMGAGGATSDVHGDEYLKGLPSSVATQVKKLAAGEMAFPSGFALKSPYWQNMINMVAQYDPTFDTINYGTRASTRKAFTSGQEARQINAMNTVIGHLNQLSDAADALDNGSLPYWNAAINYGKSQLGDPRANNFNTVKKGVVDELTRVWRGNGGSEQDIKTWSQSINNAGSPAQLHEAIATIGHMLESKISSMAEQYKKGMGPSSAGISLVSPEARKTLNILEKRAGNTPSSGARATADDPMGLLQ